MLDLKTAKKQLETCNEDGLYPELFSFFSAETEDELKKLLPKLKLSYGLQSGSLHPVAIAGFADEEALRLLVEKYPEEVASHDNFALRAACYEGNLESVKFLLQHESVKLQIAIKDNEALRVAARKGHLEIVKLLLTFPEVQSQITAKNNEALRISAGKGHFDIVRFLMQHPEVQSQVTVDNNGALRLAMQNNSNIQCEEPGSIPKFFVKNPQIEIVKYLLQDSSVRTHIATVYDSCSLGAAALLGDLELFEKLLQNSEVQQQVAVNGNWALKAASAGGHIEIIKCLLQYPAVLQLTEDKTAWWLRTALVEAASAGHIAVVDLLLQYSEIQHQITAGNNWALISASREGHINVVQRLLQCQEVTAQMLRDDYSINTAIEMAAGNGHVELANYLKSSNYRHEASPQSETTKIDKLNNLGFFGNAQQKGDLTHQVLEMDLASTARP